MESPTAAESKVVDAQLVEQELTKEVGDVLSALESVANVTDAESRARAVEWGVKIGEKERKLKETRKKIVDPARQLYEYLRGMFDGKIDALAAGKKLLSSKVSAYDVEQERLARLEREKKEKERREAEEKHKREMAAWQFEQDHLQAFKDDEAWVKAKEDQRARDERARLLREEEAGRIQHAESARDLGMTDRVDTILEKATPIAPSAPSSIPATSPAASLPALPPAPPPPPPPPPPAAMTSVASFASDGTIKKTAWKWELEDVKEFCRAVAEGRAPAFVEYRGKRVPILEVHAGFITQEVNRLKDEFVCPGVKAWPERVTQFKAGKGEDA